MANNNNPIQWFPGHMAKTRRMMTECLPNVDVVLEVLDARIPKSSKNPDMDSLVTNKPRIVILTKCSLADPELTKAWIEFFRKNGTPAVAVDSFTGFGIPSLSDTIKKVLNEKIERYIEKGMTGRSVKAMIVGIPNVGKSSLINRLAKGKKAKVENRPGVTLNKQWVTTDIGIDLLDMPGVLWHKFDDHVVGENLAMTGAIKDAILDTEEVAMILCSRLYEKAQSRFLSRYKLTKEETEGLDAYDLFELVGKKRGVMMSGGEIDHTRLSSLLLEEFRSGKIGAITLESPEDFYA